MFSTIHVPAIIVLALTLLDHGNATTIKERPIKKHDNTHVSLKDNHRIIGGGPVSPGTYPWFASAMYGEFMMCGGMLVAPEYVLTAAHCVGSFNAFDIGALCNTSGNCGQPNELIPMSGLPITHPQYSKDTNENDFALVKLERRSTITPVLMDSDNLVSSYSSNKSLWTIGFGNTDPNGYYFPDELFHVEVKYVPQSTCMNNYNNLSLAITSDMMCAADPGQDSCQGDSGGPLMDRENNKLVGIVSWGVDCAHPDYPGVYAKISSQWPWIKDTICYGHSFPKPDYCDGSCSNTNGWTDVDGDGCEWYANNGCESWGYLGANEHCCACGGGCTDSPLGWHDSDGDDCAWYAEETRCEVYGDGYADANGITANMACCACGGGGEEDTFLPFDTQTPSNPPSFLPTKSPTFAPTSIPTSQSDDESSFGGFAHAIEILLNRKR